MGNCTVQSRTIFRQNRTTDHNLMAKILMYVWSYVHVCIFHFMYLYVCVEAWMAEYLPHVHL